MQKLGEKLCAVLQNQEGRKQSAANQKHWIK